MAKYHRKVGDISFDLARCRPRFGEIRQYRQYFARTITEFRRNSRLLIFDSTIGVTYTLSCNQKNVRKLDSTTKFGTVTNSHVATDKFSKTNLLQTTKFARQTHGLQQRNILARQPYRNNKIRQDKLTQLS